ncbi:MAG: hypothetical protein IJU76_08375 [Desulfovibrionaceae bacterium]|nr:hypothetical protein [Desulfovibrionaceae bacterium]
MSQYVPYEREPVPARVLPVGNGVGNLPPTPPLSPMQAQAMQDAQNAQEFYQGFEQSQTESREKKEVSGINALAIKLRGEFEEAENAREMVNLRWLEDLQQYRGIYGEDVIKRLECSKGSMAFYRLTTAKVNTMCARLMDLLFPQRVKNWSIEATPDPMIPSEIIEEEFADEIAQQVDMIVQQQAQQLMANGIQPDELQLQQIMAQAHEEILAQYDTQENRVRVAKERAKKMEQVIDDQLKEGSANGQLRPSWRQNCRQVVKSACLYGMGVLKGPLIEEIDVKRYQPYRDATGQMQWEESTYTTEFRPYHEAVSIWEVYPDPGARVPGELRYVWQRHTKTDKDLRELFRIPGFRVDKIQEYMKNHPDGDAEVPRWEEQVRQLNSDNVTNGGSRRLLNRFSLYERWGYLTGQDLYDAGVEVPDEDKTQVYSSCVWMLGDVIIKAAINPLEGVDIPYMFYPYQEDDSSFWPEGIAYQLRTPQACINSAVRAMQDNAGMTAGPIIGVNVANLSWKERLDDMKAGKVFLFDKPSIKLQDCFQAVTVPSSIEQNLNLTTFWSNVADEISTPRFNQGDGNVQGAGQTASGLSMLMGASNILLKDHVKDFDDNIVAPFIRAVFKWNMKWNSRSDIKGDFEVVASGSQSLIAKEVRAQQIPILIQYLQIEDFRPFLKPKELLEVALEQTDLPAERVLRTDEEAQQYQQDQFTQMAQAGVQALMQQLQQSGMTPEQIRAQLMLVLGKSLDQGPQLQPPKVQESAGGTVPTVSGGVPPAPPDPSPEHMSGRKLPITAQQ